jgi:hypothetical protein
MAFRFVHNPDIHLDSPLATLPLGEPDSAESIFGPMRKAFVAALE